MEPRDMEELSERSAERAVERLLLRLGVNVEDDPAAVVNLREDLAFVRRLRTAQDVVRKQGLRTAVTVLVTAVLAALWLGIQDKLSGN